MRLRYITLGLAAALGMAAASAQSLKKEITVEHDIVPEKREATRLNIMPTLNLSPISATRLNYSERTLSSRIPGALTTLGPAAVDDGLYMSPYRGYASLGVFPLFNMDLSAGYKLVDTQATQLNGWLQYDGTAYKRDDAYYRRNTATLGVNLRQAINATSQLSAGVGYTFGRYNLHDAMAMRNQNVNQVDLNALFESKAGELDYNIGAAFDRFAYGNNPDWHQLQPGTFSKSQSIFDISGGVSGTLSENTRLGADVEFSTSSLRQDLGAINASKSDQLLSITPKLSLLGEKAVLDLGAKVDLTFNGDKAFHIAPAAKLTLIPAPVFNIYLKAGGGEERNTLASLYNSAPYVQPYNHTRFAHIPLTVDAGITIGSWRGFYADLYGGYAIANNWLMPAYMEHTSVVTFEAVDMKGWHVGAAVGYAYGELVDFKASIEGAPQKYDRGYYLWRDRAKNVIDLSVRVTPISELDITAGLELRTKRSTFKALPMADLSNPDVNFGTIEYESTDLGDISNLKLGATYRIDSQWSAFLKTENLLNKKYLLPGNIPAQGITGLIGVAYKF